jgi:alpha-L-fucosidase
MFVKDLEITLDVPEGLTARYAIGTGEPSLYTGPFRIAETTVVTARTHDGDESVGPLAARAFEKVEPLPEVLIPDPNPGLQCRVYAGTFDRMPNWEELTPESLTVVDRIALGDPPDREHVARLIEGYLEVPADDVYVFSLASDDGSRLNIGDRVVIDNDGLHAIQTKKGAVPLARGLHWIRVEFFNRTGGAALELRFARAGEDWAALPPNRLFHYP